MRVLSMISASYSAKEYAGTVVQPLHASSMHSARAPNRIAIFQQPRLYCVILQSSGQRRAHLIPDLSTSPSCQT